MDTEKSPISWVISWRSAVCKHRKKVQAAEKSATTAHQLTRGVSKKSGGSREGGVASEGGGSLHMEKSLNMVGRMSMHSKMILTACWQKSSPRWDRYRLQKNVVVHELAVQISLRTELLNMVPVHSTLPICKIKIEIIRQSTTCLPKPSICRIQKRVEQACTGILSQSSEGRRCSTSLSQRRHKVRPRSPLPQNIIYIMHPADARVRTVKIPPVHKIVSCFEEWMFSLVGQGLLLALRKVYKEKKFGFREIYFLQFLSQLGIKYMYLNQG